MKKSISKELSKFEKFYQPFHLVTFSPWPLTCSFSVMVMLVGVMNWFTNYSYMLMIYGIIMLSIISIQWWRDVLRESNLQGVHTVLVVKGLKLGMLLFIVSEVFFFISIFWCYLHMFLSPSIEIGSIWPPKNIQCFNPYEIPLLNTIILLSSGVFVTWSHYSMLLMKLNQMKFSLMITILLGIVFTLFQYYEYLEASFTISDSVYGSIFFLATGFHGFHVLIGTMFLLVNYFRMNFENSFSYFHHVGFEMSIWYWHFVDVVWLFLYLLIYLWSS